MTVPWYKLSQYMYRNLSITSVLSFMKAPVMLYTPDNGLKKLILKSWTHNTIYIREYYNLERVWPETVRMYGHRKTNTLLILNIFTGTDKPKDWKSWKGLNQTELIGWNMTIALNWQTTTHFFWWCTDSQRTVKHFIDNGIPWKPGEIGFTSYTSYLEILMSQRIRPLTF